MKKHTFAIAWIYDESTGSKNAEYKEVLTMKKLIVIGIAVLTLAAGSITAFATSQYSTPTEAVAGLTGREVQSVIDERTKTGKTCGIIANEAGVLDKFKAEMLEIKKDTLAARVAAGRMTQAQADTILSRIEAKQAVCDGAGTGCGMGSGFGQSGGQGHGQGDRSMGNGLRDGSCLSQ